MVKTERNSFYRKKFKKKTVPECVKAVWGIPAVCGGLERFSKISLFMCIILHVYALFTFCILRLTSEY